jgi:hypothetical protein
MSLSPQTEERKKELLPFLLRTPEGGVDSNVCPETGYPEIFHGFPQSLLANARIAP